MITSPTPQQPPDLELLFNQALRDHSAGQLPEAAAAYRLILALRPDLAEVHNNLGILLCQQGALEEAAQQFEQAIAAQADLADAHNNLANVLRQQGKLDQAAARMGRVISLFPGDAGAHNNLGNILREQKKLGEAAAQFEKAIALRPDYATAYNNLGNVLSELGQLDWAVRRFEQAINLKSDYAEAFYNLGIAHWHRNELDRAVIRFKQAITLQPDYFDALNNLGSTLRELDQMAEARAVFERLELLRPGSPQSQLGLATCYLLDEDYRRGWPAFEGRLGLPGASLLPNLPRWRGEPLAGRTLLFWGEAGFGDTLQFVRYAKFFKARGARIVLAAQAALGPLLSLQPDWDEIYLLGSDKPLPPVDFYLPLMSAPLALSGETLAIPREVPYLRADPALVEKWRQELAALEGLKIGIVWQGAREYAFDRWRSFPLAQLAPLARVPGAKLISLQKGSGTEQIATAGFPLVDLSGRLDEATGPFMDTAAVIQNLDVIVAPNSGMAHLAGALGVPVCLAMHFSPDWRWLRQREDSVWYPKTRIFRQQAFGQWPDVFEWMAEVLRAVGGKASPR